MKQKIIAVISAFALLNSGYTMFNDAALNSNHSKRNNIVSATETNLKTRDVICSNEDVNRWESEHFQFIWGKNGTDSALITREFLEKNAENMEACWDIYMNNLTMRAPVESVNPSLRDGNQYKVNFYISGTGLSSFKDDWAYMAYDSQGFAYMFCCVGAMQTEPPSWVLPHEFGHVVTAHQLGWNDNKYTYAWYESVGNWYREQFLYSDFYKPYIQGEGLDTDYFETFMKNLCFTAPCGRDYYAAWPLLQYLTENPDNMNGYGADFVKKMLQEGKKDEYPLLMIERLAPADFKDTIGNFAKRLATLDFENQKSYHTRQEQLFRNGNWNWQQIYTIPDQLENSWYTIPTERTPQQCGINIIPLEISQGIAEVTLKGLTDIKGADWRACIVVEDSSGKTRYSDLFSAGETMTMQLDANDKNAYITVAATPDSDTFVKSGLPFPNSEFSEDRLGFEIKTRYPYMLKIEGTKPLERIIESKVPGAPHINGGGFVASTAKVDPSVYVGKNAKVLGYAVVTDNAVIDDYAVVEGSAKVSGNALINGRAIISENAVVSGNAVVTGNAGVMGKATVSGNARVTESAFVYGEFSMKDNATAKGISFCMANGSISEQGITDGDYYDDGNKKITRGTAYGWVSEQSYADSRQYTDGVYTDLEFSSDSSLTAADKYTSSYGISVNTPLWEQKRTGAEGVITLDGKKQYIKLDRSLVMSRNINLQTAVLWRGGAAEQKVFFGGSSDKYLYFTPSSNEGKAEFVITDGKSTQKLTADSSLVQGEWSVISIVISEGKGKLIINGKTEAEEIITIDPVLTTSADGICAIGKGTDDGYFNGSVDYFRAAFKETSTPDYIYTEKENINNTVTGDINSDGIINIADLVLLKSGITAGFKAEYSKTAADFNNDGSVTTADLIDMIKYFIFR